MSATGTYASVVTSPATTTRPVVTSVSTATRLCGSSARSASRTESLIWSAILSGCPSVTDSDVKRRPVTPFTLPTSPPGDRGVQDPMGQDVLRPGVRAVGHDPASVLAEQGDLVVLAAEHLVAADRVQDQQVAALACELGAAEGHELVLVDRRLGREPHDHLVRVLAGLDEPAEHVGGLHEGEGGALVAGLLDLDVTDPGRREVRRCSGHHHDVRVLGRAGHRCTELGGAAH